VNSFGRIFRIEIFGESHGFGIGVLLDGVPAGLPLDENDFTSDLKRRKPGQRGTTKRVEADIPLLEAGVFKGRTTGAPLLIRFINKDQRSKDYEEVRDQPRPGHADFTSAVKYGGYNDHRGGGHFSGRLTAGIVAAGVIAKKVINPCMVRADLLEVGGRQDIEGAIDQAMTEGDSVGGLIRCKAEPMPVGLGEPFFDSVESVVSHGLFAIPAVKSVGFGSGYRAAAMRGSEHNDGILNEFGKTATNNAGGINGGISNGNPLLVEVVIKPTSSISKEQQTYKKTSNEVKPLQIKGRHDVCIALRAPVVVEAMVACCLADLLLLRRTQG
jgi:chorismate synthase